MIYKHHDINPFIGYEGDGENSLMIGRNGEYTIGYKMILPPIFTIPEEIYDAFIELFDSGIKSLPNYCRIHRQDFITEEYIDLTKIPCNSFFDKEYMNTFSTRPMLKMYSYIYFTLIPSTLHSISICNNSSFKRKGTFNLSTTERNEFKERVSQFVALMCSLKNSEESGAPSYIKMVKLQPKDYLASISSESEDGVLAKHLFLQKQNYSDISYNHKTAELRVGEEFIDIFSISSLENMPPEINSCYEFSSYNLMTCWGAFISPILRFPHVVNTYIIKGNPENEKTMLEQKKNFLTSLSTVARSNSLGAEEIEGLLNYAEEKKASIIDAHINIMFWDKNEKELTIKKHAVNSILTNLGCHNPKAESYNKLNLFIASLAGGAVNIFNEYRFKTFDKIGALINNYVGLQESNIKDNHLRVIDRLSKSPIQINLSEPYTKYNINKNKFVLGGSGSGKSFMMNHYIKNKLDRGGHVVIVDVGRSYEGLCSAYEGLWFEFTPDKPLSFNPFILSSADWLPSAKKLSEEKLGSLLGIIKVLWKNTEGVFDQTENIIIQDLLTAYYRDDSIKIRKFDTFYEFALEYNFNEKIDFNKEKFFFNLKAYYKTGDYPLLLNAELNESLVNERFIIFELDNIKSNKLLLSVTTAIIMDTFVTKMDKIIGEKIIMFEEAWAALSNEEMASNIKWLAKTARKWDSELIIVTQELEDILNSKEVGKALISNCSTKILLDQSNFKTDFEVIQRILGLSDFQKSLVLSIGKGKEIGDKSKDFFASFQYGKNFIVQTSVSRAEALLYSTNQSEKNAIKTVSRYFSISYAEAIEYIMKNMIDDIDKYMKKDENCSFYNAVQFLLKKNSVIA